MDDYLFIKRFTLLKSSYSYLFINIRFTLVGYILYKGYYSFFIYLIRVIRFFNLNRCGLKSHMCGLILIGLY